MSIRILWLSFGLLTVWVSMTDRTWGHDAARAGNTPVSFSDSSSSTLPYDVDLQSVRALVKSGNIKAAHAQFAELAWRAFIALNWPAEPNGQPSRTRTIADTTAPRVWDSWRTSDTLFLPQGKTPEPWTGRVQASTGFRWKSAWRQHTTQGGNLEAFSGPLVDQNGKWVRYQIRVNREEFDYIVQNSLYSQDGQVRFSQRDEHNQVELPLNQGNHLHGAIEIKFAWKELGVNDDPSRFYTRELTSDLSEPLQSDGKPVPPRKFKAGLVGMHISMRTQSSPEWIWATFEQVDNVRVNHYADGRPTHPNFVDPAKGGPFNGLPTANAVLDPATGGLKRAGPGQSPDRWIESLTTTPVQVQRVKIPLQVSLNPLDDELDAIAQAINGQAQSSLATAQSVFQYYELIDVQWPVHPNAPAAAGGNGSAPESITNKTPGDMVPVFLVNTTMETYFQKGEQPAGPLEQDDRLPPGQTLDSTVVKGSESCVGCHYSSGIAIGFKKDLQTGLELVDRWGVPIAVFGENNHFGKTGNASFSWMLQLEPKAKRRDLHDPHVTVLP